MDLSICRAQFFNCISQRAKANNMKYSKGSFCAYQRVEDIFWSANFSCGFFLVDGKLEVIVDSQVKPGDFDSIQFSIIEPGRPCRITDAMRATAAFAAKSLQIGSTKYYFPCEDAGSFSAGLENSVETIFIDFLERRSAFFTNILSNYGGLPQFLKAQWEVHPYEAGMAFLCEGDYDAAIRCFELAEKNGCYVTKSVGTPGRYLHLIFIDYCTAKKTGIEWTDSLVTGGFAESTE